MHFHLLPEVNNAGDADRLNKAVPIHHDIVSGVSLSGMKVKGKHFFQICLLMGLFPGSKPFFPAAPNRGIV